MGFPKKLRDTTEKAVGKGAEVSTKAYDGAKEAAEKGRDKARQKG